MKSIKREDKMDLLTLIASEYDIPVVRRNQKVWFFRTKAGKYYYDFQLNGFIALGWDLVSNSLITDPTVDKEKKKEQIEELYPEEKRPGLILAQLDVFYNLMQDGDIVVIPASGSKQIAIGKIGGFLATVEHKLQTDEYEKCEFVHKRKVEWLKKVDTWQDIYLFKALRAQQTISDITEETKVLFRNLFPVYISEDAIHLTFQKKTEADLNLVDNVLFQANLLNIADAVAELYGVESFKKDISVKTAVGSPGFIEMILPNLPVSVIATVTIVSLIIGKAKSSDGSTVTGIMAVINQINNLVNDYHNRKKVDAETKKITAETELINAQIAKTNAEAWALQHNNEQIAFNEYGKTTIQIREEQEMLTIADKNEIAKQVKRIEENGNLICEAAHSNGLLFNGNKIEQIS